MDFFSQVIFPRLCDFLLNKSLLTRHRRGLLATAQGDVLEIGFGTGLNLSHYTAEARRVTAIEPARVLPERISQRIAAVPFPVSARAKRIPINPTPPQPITAI